MKRKKLWATVAVVCVLALLGGGLLFWFQNPYRFGFSSPEKAVKAYVNSLKKGDLKRCVQTASPKVFGSRFNAESYYNDYLSAFMITTDSGPILPTDTKADKALMAERQRGKITEMAQIQYEYLLLRGTRFGEEEKKGSPIITIREEGIGREYVRAAKRDTGLSELRIVSVDEAFDRYAEGKVDADTRKGYRNILEGEKKIYGADELRDVCAELQIGGERFVLFLLTARFGSRWYVAGMGKVLLCGGSLDSARNTGGLVPKEALG